MGKNKVLEGHFVRVKCDNNVCDFLFYLFSDLASNSSELLSAFLSIQFLFFLFFWSGLFCCIIVPGTLAFQLPYLDQLRSFMFFCLTESDHKICISTMNSRHGHWVQKERFNAKTTHTTHSAANASSRQYAASKKLLCSVKRHFVRYSSFCPK